LTGIEDDEIYTIQRETRILDQTPDDTSSHYTTTEISTSDEIPEDPVFVPPLPNEIHRQVLSYLSISELFYARQVNQWYREACVERIIQHYRNGRRIRIPRSWEEW